MQYSKVYLFRDINFLFSQNEQAFVAHTLSVLVDISMKAYVYYHCYKTSRSVTSP